MDEKKPMTYEEWHKRYHTQEYMDIKKFFNNEDFEILKKLGIKTMDKIYTGYEYETLSLEIAKYYVDDLMDEEEIAETVPLDNTGVTREEFNELMKKVEIMNQIFYNYERF